MWRCLFCIRHTDLVNKEHQGKVLLNTYTFPNLTINTISIEMPPHLGELPVQNWFVRKGKYFPRPPVCSDRRSMYFGKAPHGATTKPFRDVASTKDRQMPNCPFKSPLFSRLCKTTRAPTKKAEGEAEFWKRPAAPCTTWPWSCV